MSWKVPFDHLDFLPKSWNALNQDYKKANEDSFDSWVVPKKPKGENRELDSLSRFYPNHSNAYHTANFKK